MCLINRQLSYMDKFRKATGVSRSFSLFQVWRTMGRMWYNKLLIYSVHEES